MIDLKSNKERVFWDGGLLSNTPIRELLHHHRRYWMDYYDLKKENDDNNYDYLNSNNNIKKSTRFRNLCSEFVSSNRKRRYNSNLQGSNSR